MRATRKTTVAPTRNIWVWGSLDRMLGIREAMILSHCRVSARGGECEGGVVDTGTGQLGRDEVEIEEGKRKERRREEAGRGEGKGRSTYRNLTHSLVPRVHIWTYEVRYRTVHVEGVGGRDTDYYSTTLTSRQTERDDEQKGRHGRRERERDRAERETRTHTTDTRGRATFLRIKLNIHLPISHGGKGSTLIQSVSQNYSRAGRASSKVLRTRVPQEGWSEGGRNVSINLLCPSIIPHPSTRK